MTSFRAASFRAASWRYRCVTTGVTRCFASALPTSVTQTGSAQSAAWVNVLQCSARYLHRLCLVSLLPLACGLFQSSNCPSRSMMKTLCLVFSALAACSAPVQAQLDGSIIAGKVALRPPLESCAAADHSFHSFLLLAGVTNQVESFWTELFNGGTYSKGFLSSLNSSDDEQHKLKIPETGTPLVDIHSFVRHDLLKCIS